MKKIIHIFLLLVLLSSCSIDKNPTLEKGMYRGELTLLDNKKMPFLFEVKNDSVFTIYNAEEEIEVRDISYVNDSIKIHTPVFEGYLLGKIENNELHGQYIKSSMNRVIPFTAKKETERFETKLNPTVDVTGNWETQFTEEESNESYQAKGILTQTGPKVTGTFRTATGDYRYLDGVVDGDSLKLSTYDGSRVLLFLAKVSRDSMNGVFYKGNHGKERFTAKKNENFQLPNESNLISVKRGYENFDFSFTDAKGRLVSLSDPEFNNKAIVIQIMGSWCANCLDESRFLSAFYKANQDKDFTIISLAFEVVKTREKAYERIRRLTESVGITYPILLAQYGNNESKQKALEKLPMLNNLNSFPTTIYLDKTKTVRKIESGFNGPATGAPYEIFKKEFESFVNELINEETN